MPLPPPIDHALSRWDELADLYVRDRNASLLIGNGASLAFWHGFSYSSLFEVARDRIEERLTDADLRLFQGLGGGTNNFEEVLSAIRAAGFVARACDGPQAFVESLGTRYRHIKNALAAAVRQVHIPHRLLSGDHKLHIRAILSEHDAVFTTNYDLVLYWAVNHDGDTRGFKDFFWTRDTDECLVFDASNTGTSARPKIYYLHGGLHLFRDVQGRTIKRTPGYRQNLLDLFSVPFRPNGGVDAVPLIVTEGDSQSKARSIARSDYLSFALSAFTRVSGPLVVFGHSLDTTYDAHVLRAIRKARPSRLAVSVYPTDDPRDTASFKARIQKALNREADFFDSRTHPLGLPGNFITRFD